MTEHVEDVVLPVWTVRVPAQTISDRKFVTVKRKRGKQKEFQKNCKTS